MGKVIEIGSPISGAIVGVFVGVERGTLGASPPVIGSVTGSVIGSVIGKVIEIGSPISGVIVGADIGTDVGVGLSKIGALVIGKVIEIGSPISGVIVRARYRYRCRCGAEQNRCARNREGNGNRLTDFGRNGGCGGWGECGLRGHNRGHKGGIRRGRRQLQTPGTRRLPKLGQPWSALVRQAESAAPSRRREGESARRAFYHTFHCICGRDGKTRRRHGQAHPAQLIPSAILAMLLKVSHWMVRCGTRWRADAVPALLGPVRRQPAHSAQDRSRNPRPDQLRVILTTGAAEVAGSALDCVSICVSICVAIWVTTARATSCVPAAAGGRETASSVMASASAKNALIRLRSWVIARPREDSTIAPVLKKSNAISQIRQERRDFDDGGKESFTISNPASESAM